MKLTSLNGLWVLNSFFICMIAWIVHSWQLSSGLYLAYNFLYIFFIFLNHKKINFSHVSPFFFGIGTFFLLGSPIIFENDFYRYIWEGKVLLAGKNPYVLSPDSPLLNDIIYSDKNKVGFPDLPTLYPPLAILLFSVVSVFSQDSLIPIKLLGVINAVLIYFLIKWLLKKEIQHYQLALVFPLLSKEFINSVHVDLFAAFFVFTILLKINLSRGSRLFLILLSFLTKIVGVFYLYSWFLENYKNLKMNKLTFAFSLVILIVIGYLIYVANLPANNGSSVYIGHWVWNSGFFSYFWRLGLSSEKARVLSLSSLCLSISICAGIGIKYRLREQFLPISTHLLLAFFACFCFMFPVFNSWYAVWLIIPALLTKNKWAVLYASFSFLSYTYYFNQSLVIPAELMSHIWFYPTIYFIIKKLKLQYFQKFR